MVLAASVSLGIQKGTAEIRFSAGIEINAASDFYAPLGSEGAWVDARSYGRCWHPRVAAGWRPYTTGHWEWTDVGWYWVSDEPWSWACYHYGSWANDPSYGWVWVPGTEWAPSWVTWRESDDYIGWAPCGPRGAVLAPSLFVFVDVGHFRDHLRPERFVVNNTTIINRTKVVNNFRRETRTIDGAQQRVVINQGPRTELVQRASGGRLSPTSITRIARETPVPSTVKHSPLREGVTQEPSRTGRDQSRTYQPPPAVVAPQQRERVQPARSPETPPVISQRPQAQAVPPPTARERVQPARSPETAPAIPQRPPVQTAPPPTARERVSTNREQVAPPPTPATPPREQQPGRKDAVPERKSPPPEKEPGHDGNKERERDKP
jgi:hypothetical protein